MKPLYTFLACLTATCLLAQIPSISPGSLNWSPGESFPLQQDFYYPPGSSGPNVTYDFSTLVSGGTIANDYLDPATTPYASSFPNSTVAVTDGLGSYGYYTGTNTSLGLDGFGSTTANFTCVDDIQILIYPFTFGDSFNDQLDCSGTSGGTPFARSGTSYGNADGYGTLIMPYGTIDNVLRVWIQQDYTDILSGTTIDYDLDGYLFYKPGVKFPILSLWEIDTDFSFTSYSQFLDQTVVSIEEALKNEIGVELYPNPASDVVDVVYSGTGSAMMIQLFDMTGRIVTTQELGSGAPGIFRKSIDISGLNSGAYNVRIVDENGAFGTKRLVIQ